MTTNSKNQFKILAIETSCDETSAAVLDVTLDTKYHIPNTNIVSNIVSSQVKLHAKYGGVYPELASREHIKNIIPVIIEALHLCHADTTKNIKKEASRSNPNEILHFVQNDISRKIPNTYLAGRQAIYQILDTIDYIAVTSGPGLIGSLLVGTETAKTLSYMFQKPIVAVNHLEGHIYANFIGCHCERAKVSEAISIDSNSDCHVANAPRNDNNSTTSTSEVSPRADAAIQQAKRFNNLSQFPILALIVSGGHTSLIYMKNHLDYKIIGETLDDAAGEAYDKVAAMLGLKYPGGPEIDAYASKLKVQSAKCKVTIKNSKLFPRPLINANNFNFSFSGLKTSVLYYLKKCNSPFSNQLKQKICYEFQEAVVETLVTKTLRAAKKYKVKSVIISGGVAANSRLRDEFKLKVDSCMSNVELFLPEKRLCTDNAAMIGAAAVYKILAGKIGDYQKVKADPNLPLS